MKITRRSAISGTTNTLDLEITPDQLARWARGGALVQECFPNLSPPEREFILTGITPDEWTAAFPPEDDEEMDDVE